MRRKKEERSYIWVQGEWWERGEYERVQALAIAVPGADVQLIDRLVRHFNDENRRAARWGGGGVGTFAAEQCQRLVRDLYERAGAAAAVQADPQGVPLTVAEVGLIEKLRGQLQHVADCGIGGSRDPMLDKADDLLNRFHFLIGQARATSAAGGVTVFAADAQPPAGRRQLPAAG